MVKRVIGIILLVLAGLSIFGGIVNGSLFEIPVGSMAHVIGFWMGKLIGFGGLICVGIILIVKSRK